MPKTYMGTQVSTRDVHNVDVAGYLFCGSHGRLIRVIHGAKIIIVLFFID